MLPQPATVSAYCIGLDGSVLLSREEHAQHYAASTMKLPLAVAAYRRHERGELDLDATLRVHNSFSSAADGSPFALDRADDQDDATWDRLGDTVPLRLLVRHAIVRSGNLATNLALEEVGAGEVASVLEDAGCTSDTVLPRGIEDVAAREAGLDNLVTAHDLALLMAGIANRTLAGEDACVEIEAVLAAQEHRDMIPAGLPPGTYVANKTGWVDGVVHDIALVRPDGQAPFVLAVSITANASEAELTASVVEIARSFWEARTP